MRQSWFRSIASTSGRAALFVLGLSLAAAAAGQGTAPTVQERLGYPRESRLLVLHADDIGMAHSVNRASFEAFRRGFITSGSILVPCPWFAEVAAFARAHPEADLGIHLALNSEWTPFRWGPVLAAGVPSLLDDQGYLPLLQAPVARNAKLDEVERELRAQIEKARSAGIKLTHLDTHMGTLGFTPGLFRIYQRLGWEFGLPILQEREAPSNLKAEAAAGEALIDRVVGVDPGVSAADWGRAYQKILAPLPPGVHQLIVHLAHDDDEMRGATFDHPDFGAAWRQQDFDLVGSAEFRRFLKEQGFVLVGWKYLARALPPGYSMGR